MTIPVVRRILEENENAARENRERFDALGVTCVNLIGGAGCGKTSLLEAALPRLTPSLRVGVLEGDVATTRDAARIMDLEVPVVQLLTEGGCHLTAGLVQQALERVPLESLDLLIIENVGNPICPANFDLGEHFRVAAISVADGDDKPAKYPLLFKSADMVLLTKCDLMPYVDFQLERLLVDLRRVNPAAELISTDIRGRTGVDRLVSWLLRRVSVRTESPLGTDAPTELFIG